MLECLSGFLLDFVIIKYRDSVFFIQYVVFLQIKRVIVAFLSTDFSEFPSEFRGSPCKLLTGILWIQFVKQGIIFYWYKSILLQVRTHEVEYFMA